MSDKKLKSAMEVVHNDRSTDAIELLPPLAQIGDIRAQALLGAVYIADQKVLNTKEAVKWLKSAAESGNANAAHNLGVLYMTTLPGIQTSKKKVGNG